LSRGAPLALTTNTRAVTLRSAPAGTDEGVSIVNSRTGGGAGSSIRRVPNLACVVPGGTTMGMSARPAESARTGPNHRSPMRTFASPRGVVFTWSSPVPASGTENQPKPSAVVAVMIATCGKDSSGGMYVAS
jgi:hypothetical protein